MDNGRIDKTILLAIFTFIILALAEIGRGALQPRENTKMNPMILVQLFSALPQLVQAVQTILASDAAHTIESSVAELVNHNTKGKPNSPALS